MMTTFDAPRDMFALRDALAEETSIDPEYSRGAAARVWARWHTGHALWVRELKCWARWDGVRWRMNADGEVRHAMHNFCSGLAALARGDETLGRGAMSTARMIAGDGFIEGAVSLARGMLPAEVADFDRDAWLLNAANGVIDLRTGTLQPHNAAARMTRASPVAYDAAAALEGTRFGAFLDEVFDGDQELIAFTRAALGYCLTGDNTIHAIFFWFGGGRNGKNTLGDAVMHVMGDYARKIESRVLMRASVERHPTEIAQLRGVRLAVGSEIAKGAFWDEARIKEMTGDGTLNARGMRQDPFTFNRTHKHLIYGNHKPRLTEVDDAMKARLKLTHFGVNFETLGRLDPGLPERLVAEAGVVLRWAVEGAMAVWAAGRRLPGSAAVKAATDEYMDENDVLREWISDQCHISDELRDDGHPRLVTKSRDLYRNYADWKKARGEGADAESGWRQMMRGAGYKTAVRNGKLAFVGIALIFNPEEEVGGGKVVNMQQKRSG